MTSLSIENRTQIQVARSDDRAKELDRFLAGIERRALRIAQYATSNTDDALDIVQDAMLALARKYAHKDADDWPPLFYRILESRITDWHRRQKTRRGVFAFFRRDESEEAEHVPIQESMDENAIVPERLLHSDELGAALHSALNSLPQRQQQTFMLRVWEGLDVAETAFALKISTGSVKTHLARANASLRKALAGFHHEQAG